MIIDQNIKHRMVNSLRYFTQIFYHVRTGRKFELSEPPGRESHYITICRELVKVFDGKTKRLIINVPPRYGKTELLIHFTAWAMAQYPDSNFLYISYAHSLAKKQTQTIRSILQLNDYHEYFGVRLKDDTSAKDNFETTNSGSVYAAGAGGSITGRGAGIKGIQRFGGAIIIDDIHKPDEVSSDTIREGINDWYYNTLQSRINSPDTPIIFIGQRLHEDDLAARLIASGEWDTLIIPAIDAAGNPLHPQMHDLKTLKRMQEESPYTFAAQYQQNPQPAGGGIFKPEWFVTHEHEPHILATFITVDSAETDKDYNDATVFSFWGLYKIKVGDVESDQYGLHWINCIELRVEPKDLKNSFLNFYADCMKHKVKPTLAAIEKKSTGVTLLSVLKEYQGLQLIEIERTKASGSKTARFLEAQQYVAQRLVSLPTYGRHTDMCIEHCRKITANDSHRFDDIADTMYDAIKLALIDKTVVIMHKNKKPSNELASYLLSTTNKIDRLKRDAYR
jgi:predicted phage terminase large subunit-like protein